MDLYVILFPKTYQIIILKNNSDKIIKIIGLHLLAREEIMSVQEEITGDCMIIIMK